MKKWTSIETGIHTDGNGNYIEFVRRSGYSASVYELRTEVDGHTWAFDLHECDGIAEAIARADRMLAKLESGWRPVNW